MPNDQTKPRFTHDCTTCRFLGQIGEFDMYACPQNGRPTIIARIGNDGPDYSSYPLHLLKKIDSVDSLSPDTIAMLLACVRAGDVSLILYPPPEKE